MSQVRNRRRNDAPEDHNIIDEIAGERGLNNTLAKQSIKPWYFICGLLVAINAIQLILLFISAPHPLPVNPTKNAICGSTLECAEKCLNHSKIMETQFAILSDLQKKMTYYENSLDKKVQGIEGTVNYLFSKLVFFPAKEWPEVIYCKATKNAIVADNRFRLTIQSKGVEGWLNYGYIHGAKEACTLAFELTPGATDAILKHKSCPAFETSTHEYGWDCIQPNVKLTSLT